MARTNPHHDWPETNSEPPRSNGAEWESLRDELVALLDQVEDHVASAQPEKPAPKARKSPSAASNRHNAALKSVSEAVHRLAGRSAEERPAMERPAMREGVVEAINQIRARQTGATSANKPAAVPQPAPGSSQDSSELSGMATTLDALGERIASFENKVGGQLAKLDGHADISAQIGQLSEVIEMLAGAVGETGQIRRIEAQIGNLAELIASERNSGNPTDRRIEELTAAVERLAVLQTEAAQNPPRIDEALDRQANAMEMIEHSVRSIYDRIDALESAQSEPSYVDRLSQDMAALTEAVTANSEPQSLIEKIDALSQRIQTIEPPGRDEATDLAHSVTALRAVIAETMEPRFNAIEDQLAGLGEDDVGQSIETRLRQIGQRVEETSAQLKALSAAPGSAEHAAPDLDALAEHIIERTGGHSPALAGIDSVGKADLAELEERLSALFAQSGTQSTQTADHLAGVKSSISQVDRRIARLEEMINARTEIAPQPAEREVSSPLASRQRRKPDDAMPVDPSTGEARRILSQGADLPSYEPETEMATPAPVDEQAPPPQPEPDSFRIDPETVERPAKPQSSLTEAGESPFDLSPQQDAPARRDEPAPMATRSSFIEAARRSARQHEPVEEEPKSLIGRALARFQRNEEEAEAGQADPVPEAEPVTAGADIEPETRGHAEEEETQPGFLARNRRALLLGTALVVAVAMAVPLVLDRVMPSQPQAGSAELSEARVEPAAEDGVAETGGEDTDGAEPSEAVAAETDASSASNTASVESADEESMTSSVRVIDQQTSLTAARVDAATLSGAPIIDPVQTASIAYAEPAAGTSDAIDAATAPMTSAALPAIDVPESIEPAALREAAESGDQHAQFEVGAIFTEGTIVEQDFEQAAAWYERSAAQGFAPAQYRLGSLYESGRGVDRDLEMARLWYQRAAEAGNRMSMHNLASLYAGGELDSQDFAAAAHWFEEAAARGMTDSQFNLGMLYARGLGLEQDFEQSYVWFSLAARSGDEDAATAREDVARSLDAAAVQRLDDTVAEWSPVKFDLAANFAPIGTWDEDLEAGPVVENSDVILRVQLLLAKLGFEVGTPDGIAGPKTREAIAAFERETGMSETGAVNPRLLAVLGSQPV